MFARPLRGAPRGVMPAESNAEPVLAGVVGLVATALALAVGGWEAALVTAAAAILLGWLVWQLRERLSATIARRDMLERRLFALDGIDPLTGAISQPRLDDELRRQLALAQRSNTRVAVLAVDLGGFESAVDVYGRATGDEMALDAHDVLRKELRATDIVARVDRRLFIVVLPDADEESARAVVGKLIRSLRAVKRPRPDGALIDLAASIGMAISDPARHEDATELLARARAALARAQTAGGDRFAVDEPSGA